MNERIIWDLVSKAREFAVSDTPDGGKCFDQDVFHNKFAELIIKECMKVAVFKDDGTVATAQVAGYMAAGRSTAAKMIKEHFGVEE